MKFKIKQTFQLIAFLFCFINFSNAYAQDVNINASEGASDIENKDDIAENGIKPWRTFELNVRNSLVA